MSEKASPVTGVLSCLLRRSSGFYREAEATGYICVHECVSVCVCVNVNKEIYYKELAHGITEAEKSRPSKANRIILSLSLKTED